MSSSNGRTGSGSIDPYSNADVYYGAEDTLKNFRPRGRAFSVVSSHFRLCGWYPAEVQLAYLLRSTGIERRQPRRHQ
jgi:hypothetical protein